jgi:uncharacterized protein YigA (DUF484 family)
VQTAAEERFGLVAGCIAVEGPGRTPVGWRALPSGMADLVLGEAQARMGPCVVADELFGPLGPEVKSAAMVRISLWSPGRQGVLAFGSDAPDGFTRDMGAELVSFLARVVERTAERWPPVG